MNNFYILDFAGKIFIEDKPIDLREVSSESWQTKKLSLSNNINLEVIKYFIKLGIGIPTPPSLFIGKPHTRSHVHVDCYDQSYAINYIWGTQSHNMRWYQPLSESTDARKTGGSELPYYFFDDDQVREIARTDLTQRLFLTRIDVPHAVYNFSDNYRYALSFRFNEPLSWENIVTKLKPYFL